MIIQVVHALALANFAYALYFDIYIVQLPVSAPRHDVMLNLIIVLWKTRKTNLLVLSCDT